MKYAKKEIWKPIAGFDNYEVSNKGRVRSLTRVISQKNIVGIQNHTYKGKILKPNKSNNGYYQVSLYKERKVKVVSVHRIVGETFLSNPNKLPQINHKNEIKTDNRVENLEWVSSYENLHYGTRMKRCAEGRCRPIHQYSLDGVYLHTFSSTKEAILFLNKNELNAYPKISSCLNGKTEHAYGYKWSKTLCL